MKVGIIGSDERAVAIGRLLRSGGNDVSISDPANKERAERAAESLHAAKETPYRQAMISDVVLFAMPRREVDRALDAMGPAGDTVVVDAVADDRGTPRQSGAELLAHKLDSHGVVRALIDVPAPSGDVPVYGDDPEAKRTVDRALKGCGYRASDRGPLHNAINLEFAA